MTARIALLALATALVAPSVASADRPRHRSPHRHARIVESSTVHLMSRVQRQYRRIHSGMADGSITRREGRRLLRAERLIERRISRRWMSPHARANVSRMLDLQSARIVRARYNWRQRAPRHAHPHSDRRGFGRRHGHR